MKAQESNPGLTFHGGLVFCGLSHLQTPGVAAVWVVAAADEPPPLAELDAQHPLIALRALSRLGRSLSLLR